MSSVNCSNFVEDPIRGEIICVDTAEVVADHVIQNSTPWRAYDSEEWFKRAHASAITHTVHDTGLVTDIKLVVKNHKMRMLSLKMRSLQKHLRVSKDQKKLVDALTKMNRLAAQLGLPDSVKETCGIILKKIISALNPRKSKLDLYVVAAIVLASRAHGIPLRARDVLALVNRSEQMYWRVMAEISFKLGTRIPKGRVPDPRAFLQKIVNNLGLSQKVYTLASIIINALKSRGYNEGKDPAGIAAAAVYVASIIMNEKKTQREVAKASEVTEVTIRNRYKDIVDKVEIQVFV